MTSSDRSPFTGVLPPGRAFITHAYSEASSVDELIRMLPAQVAPFIFKKVGSDPRRAVSNGIVQKIRSSDCLVHVDTGPEHRSLWVNFERDYALRAGIPVFWFNRDDGLLQRDEGRPASLSAELMVSTSSYARAERLLTWLRKERSFEFTSRPTVLKMKEIPNHFIELLEIGHPVVWLIDPYVSSVVRIGWGAELEEWDFKLRSLDGWHEWIVQNSIFVRISPNWESGYLEDSEEQADLYDIDPVQRAFAFGHGIDLVSHLGPEEINWNRADDLLVRLTMMAQQSRPFFQAEGDE